MSDPQSRTTPEQELARYLLSDEYRRLLRRAVAARLGTTILYSPQHIKALNLIDAAFPELEND